MANLDFKGRVAIVTGASLGIGRATAVALGQAGANVVVNYHKHEDAADEVLHAIRDAGSRAIKHQADVSDPQAVDQMIACAVEEFGKIDIAISNAAYSDRDLFHLADLERFRRTFEVSLWGAFYLLRASSLQMIRQKSGGAVVLVSSPHAFLPVPRSMAYNMSKAALESMAKTAAIELAEHRIRVNIMQPGWTDTPGERKFNSEQDLQNAGAQIPLGRLGTSEEMANGILTLCDPHHEYMTGATLLIDGGISLPWWAQRGSALSP